MRRVYFILNYVRTIPIWIIIKKLNVLNLIIDDMRGFTYLTSGILNSDFIMFNRLLSKKKIFRNIVTFRIKSKSKVASQLSKILYPNKPDLEICQGVIEGGFTIYHGHGTTVVCEKAGKNFTLYQGVTIGKNPKPGSERVIPIFGDNVTVFTNAVVAGGITVGNNVDIGAGAVVMKDVPDNTVVIGNPCVFKSKI